MRQFVKQIPGPKGFLPLRTYFGLYFDPIGTMQGLTHEYGDLVLFHIGRQPVYLLNHPDLVEDVLVTNSRQSSKRLGNRLLRRLLGDGLITSVGEAHLQQRRMLQPMFHRRHLAGFADQMVACTQRAGERWQEGETIDVFEEMLALALAIVGRTLFAGEFETEASDIHQALTVILGRVHVASLILGEMVDELPLLMDPHTRRAVDRLSATIYRQIARHRAQGDQGDLLSLLLAAKDDAGSLSDTQVRDQAMSIFLAGFETMGVALTWTWYLLSQHPEVEAKFLAEIDQVLAKKLPTGDDLPKLKYTRQVLTESMRLYPPVWAHGRRLAKTCQLGEWEAPAGSYVIINHWLLHHDSRFYVDPDRFNPERWASDASTNMPRLAFSPFSAGPRQCIGEGFAWMEGVLALATLAQRWQMRLVPSHPVELLPVLTLRPKYGLCMTLSRRNESASGGV